MVLMATASAAVESVVPVNYQAPVGQQYYTPPRPILYYTPPIQHFAPVQPIQVKVSIKQAAVVHIPVLPHYTDAQQKEFELAQ